MLHDMDCSVLAQNIMSYFYFKICFPNLIKKEKKRSYIVVKTPLIHISVSFGLWYLFILLTKTGEERIVFIQQQQQGVARSDGYWW